MLTSPPLVSEPKNSQSNALTASPPRNAVQMRAQAKLQACRYREVRQTLCTFQRGVLLLRGEVSSYYLKQIAQSVLLNVDGVTRIDNQIHVQP